MISLYNIQTIARYERRILLRSWFFRIFSILSLFFIGVYSAAMVFNQGGFTWAFRSLPSGLIYSNIFLLNIIQSVIAVFLATDFLKRDKKLNTSEVLFIRPMTNAEYVIGKTWGLLLVFTILNALLIVLTAVYMIISTQIEFQILPLIMYFLLVSVPTLVFVIGLSYTLMILIKNQPVTFIILLGYIALILFYLGSKFNYLFDYMVFAKPLAFSDMIGFSDVKDILIHRLSYLVLGFALIAFTSWRLNRLPNSGSSGWLLGSETIAFLLIAAVGFFSIYIENKNVLDTRSEMAELSAQYYNYPVPDMKQTKLIVDPGKELKATADMELKNTTGKRIDTLLLTLNPALKVESINEGTSSLSFTRQSLLVKVARSMQPDEVVKLSMSYSGVPDLQTAYLDNKDEDVFGYAQAMTLRIDRRYGFYDEDYILLTKENLWYPVAGVPYDPSRPAIFRQQFTRFDLTVNSTEDMLPVSQGIRTTKDSLSYHFDMRDPLPQISLAIGNYIEKEVDLEGLKIKLVSVEGHDYYKEYLSELGDTLVDLLQEFLDDYERPLNMFYPYQVFSMVEVPLQFSSQAHSWTATMAQSQPQMVYFPERGFNVRQADFKSNRRWITRNMERSNQDLTEKQIQASLFTNFVRGMFSTAESNTMVRGGGGAPTMTSQSNPYSLYPNYFYYVNYITSDVCPVLNYAFESYLMKAGDDNRMAFMSRMNGLGDTERANLLLKDRSLKQIIAEEEDQQKVNLVLKAKGAYLLTWMQKQINNSNYEQYLLDYLYDNSFREIKYKELSASVESEFGVELGSFLDDWYTASKLPAFLVGDYTVTQTVDNNSTVYLIKTKVTNTGDADGLIKFTFQGGGGFGGGRGGGGGFFMGGGGGAETEPEERIIVVNANETKEVQMMLFEQPRSVTYNTLLSKNIPTTNMTFGLNAEKDERQAAEEYEKVVDIPVTFGVEGELIVDNSDPEFEIKDPAMDNPLRQFVEKRKKSSSDTEYAGEGFGPAPTTWTLSASSNYYGNIEHSAMLLRSGDGTKLATWKKVLPKAAYYDVYVYLSEQRGRGGFGPGGPRGGGGDRGRREPEGKYIYSIDSDDGMVDVELETSDFEDGWNLLGSFYISADTAKITLSDKGGADRVIADAVKWVIQK